MQKLFEKINVQKAILFIALLLILIILVELKYFISGLLGAITLYVLTRKFYLRLVEEKKRNKNLSITLIIFLIIITFAIPLWIILEILIPKINEFLSDRDAILDKFNSIRILIENNEFLKRFDLTFSDEKVLQLLNKIVSYIPSTVQWVGQTFANIFTALFILYFMLINARVMEERFKELLPVSKESKKFFLRENADLITSNAYGIPILGFAQGVIAMIGYSIFGVHNAIFWGLLTGAASIVPVLGTMFIYIPVCVYQIASGDVSGGLFLTLYCLVLVGGIDNVLRFTLLKKMADIHPLITVFGVVLGLKIFGVMGLVFGPVLLSLPGILFKIYKIEKGLGKKENSAETDEMIIPADPEI
ncbi:AI-2E family transporter [Kaistella faecalis]|uniref:AI-2E family transporter n=1 Tax=Kaistella faecalis TaxID=2852098 RepID=UPI001C496518|nr:AI-2E family transporter [Chryseobacterium faecale]UFK97868.1 AI-2E family transporter [Chryseobacterium faecale]